MSSDASARASEGSPTPGDYGELLETLNILEEEALRKVESGRVYDAENERVRIKWIRVLKDVVAEKRKVLADRDLEELTREVEELKDALEESNR